jgi:hypothetical protein
MWRTRLQSQIQHELGTFQNLNPLLEALHAGGSQQQQPQQQQQQQQPLTHISRPSSQV